MNAGTAMPIRASDFPAGVTLRQVAAELHSRGLRLTPGRGSAMAVRQVLLVDRLRDAVKRLIWPEAPQRSPAAPNDKSLTLQWHRAMHFAGSGNVGASCDDMAQAALVQHALAEILSDYDQGRAQTPAEQLLGESLAYVRHFYFGD